MEYNYYCVSDIISIDFSSIIIIVIIIIDIIDIIVIDIITIIDNR